MNGWYDTPSHPTVLFAVENHKPSLTDAITLLLKDLASYRGVQNDLDTDFVEKFHLAKERQSGFPIYVEELINANAIIALSRSNANIDALEMFLYAWHFHVNHKVISSGNNDGSISWSDGLVRLSTVSPYLEQSKKWAKMLRFVLRNSEPRHSARYRGCMDHPCMHRALSMTPNKFVSKHIPAN